jgi:radical SAM protein with 4Fe4S-binding SPASM domain
MPDELRYVPEYCVWELTLRCNMRCLHCGSAAGRAREGELTVAECLPVADALVALGCRVLALIGGEVFLFPGWEQVARRLTDRGVYVNTITNGSVLGDKQIAQIREAGLGNVGVSVDGLAEAHDKIRGVPRSFERALRALDRLRAEGIKTSVVTTLTSLNWDDLPGLHEVLVEHGVETWQIQLATPMGNMASARGLLLDPKRIPELTRFIRERREVQGMWILGADDIGYYNEDELYLRNQPGTLCAWQGCTAGLTTVGIDSVGNVKGCESLYDARFIEGNLRNESLEAIWCREDAFAYNRHFSVDQLTGSCAGCDKGARCRGGCRGVCYFTSAGLYENPYCCYPGRPGKRKRAPTKRVKRPARSAARLRAR